MISLPPMLHLIVFAIVFIVAAWFLNHYLDEQAIPNGIKRGMMVLVLSSLTSWGCGGLWTGRRSG